LTVDTIVFQDHLGVAVGPERNSGSFEIFPERSEIVSLTVVYYPVAGPGVCHRLMGQRTQINYRKPAVHQEHATFAGRVQGENLRTAVIRPTMA